MAPLDISVLHNLAVTPGGLLSESIDGRRDDGSFDFTRFFAAFDLNSDVALYLTNFNPSHFLSLLRTAASPETKNESDSFTDVRFRRAEPHIAMHEYQNTVDSRQLARDQLNEELEKLESVISQMEEANVAGVDQLKQDFMAAKIFIFDVIANSNSQALDVHLETEDHSEQTELTKPSNMSPPSPRLPPVPLPVVTPVPLPRARPLLSGQPWPSALLGEDGIAYRIVATPMEVVSDAMGYFIAKVIPPSPAFTDRAVYSPSSSSTRGSPGGWLGEGRMSRATYA